MRGCWWFFFLALSLQAIPVQSQTPSTSAFRVPTGFEIDYYANNDLATDVINLTVDSQQRVIVAGPGYLKALVDDNKDGKADRSILLANYPKDGAQGLYVDGDDLYVVGDGGLWQWPGLVGVKQSVTPAKQILKFPTGSEHTTHSIQRGPDGYWYLIAGNFTAGIDKLANLRGRRAARAGTVWRIDPSFNQRQLWSEGLRNAYDFAFTSLGDIVTYDSDDERDSGLPFYRPTRILQLNIDSDAGWVSRGWKDNEAFLTMPAVLAETGRGSPTGVTTYLHQAWPSSYFGCILAADWTFGRVWCLRREPKGGWRKDLLVESTGSLGFAPTDLAIDAEGTLLISSGGRGTQGAVFALRWKGEPERMGLTAVEKILDAPQPYDGWSQVKWKKELKEIGVDAMIAWLTEQAISPKGSDFYRTVRIQRAIECVLLETRNSPAPLPLLDKMLSSGQADLVRAAWWYLGHRSGSIDTREVSLWNSAIQRGLWKQTEPFDAEVVREMLEALALRSDDLRLNQLKFPLRFSTAQWSLLPSSTWQLLLANHYRYQTIAPKVSLCEDWPVASEILRKLASASYGTSTRGPDVETLTQIERQLMEWEKAGKDSSSLPFYFITFAIQKSLGDWRYTIPLQRDSSESSILDGYRSLATMQVPVRVRDAIALKLLRFLNSKQLSDSISARQELWRTVAMLEPTQGVILDKCLEQMEGSQLPSEKLHYLLVASQCSAPHTSTQTMSIAKGMQGLVRDVVSQNVTTDRNWPSRMLELAKLLQKRDGRLMSQLLALPDFGQSVDWVWGQAMGGQESQAREGMLKNIGAWKSEDFTEEALKFLQPSAKDPRLLNRLRSLTDRVDLERWIIEQLSVSVTADDYDRMLKAVGSRDSALALAGWKGLKPLPIQRPTDELTALVDLRNRVPATSGGQGSTVNAASEIERRLRNVLQALKVTAPSGSWNTWPIESLIRTALGPDAAKQYVESHAAIDWKLRLADAAKVQGNAKSGEAIYRAQRCATCHQGDTALGPALAGVSKRFSREDIFRAIYEPSRDIPDRYRTLQVLTVDGEVLIGLPVYDSVDGVILATQSGESVRVRKEDIEQRRKGEQSLMPEGLINDLSAQQLADLDAFLKSL